MHIDTQITRVFTWNIANSFHKGRDYAYFYIFQKSKRKASIQI